MNAGDTVEDFTATTQTGDTVRLSELVADGPIVLFFYPKAMSSGCTAESCHFRDLKTEFANHGARPVGISADSVDTQARFDTRNNLGMTLLSDTDRSIARIFGARRVGPVWNRRQTYVVDRNRVVLEVISSEMDMDLHADRALEVLAEHGAIAS